jgi:predicted hydrocarbon binding protein
VSIQLPGAQIGTLSHPQHNHYDPSKFWTRDGAGRLLNKYRQRVMLVPEDFIVSYQLALEEEVGDAAAEIMYRCGFEWGRTDIIGFEKRFLEEFGRPMSDMQSNMVLETWWWPLQAAGWGSWTYDFTQIKEGLIFVDLFDSAVAKSIGNIGKVACHYYAGLFAAVFSHMSRAELSGLEIQCYSMGEEFCKFLVGSGKRINAAQFWAREGATAKEIIARLG